MSIPVSISTSKFQFGPGENCKVCSWSTSPSDEFVASGRWDTGLCSGPNSDDSYAGCARAAAPIFEGGCGECSVVCSSRVDVDDWVADVGGTMTFDDIALDQSQFTGLPGLIPQTDGSPAGAFHEVAHPGAWAIGMRRVFSPTTWRLTPKWDGSTSAPAAMGLPTGTPTVLVGYGTDPVVENWWARHQVDDLVPRTANVGFDVVLSPNYSLYGNWPRSFHLLNFRRNLLIAQRFSDAGQLVAPNIYWYRLEDLQRYDRWIRDTSPRLLASNLQTTRQQADWDSFILPGLTWLAAKTPTDVHWVFVAGGNVARLRTVLDLFGPERVTIITQKIWQTAAHGETLGEDGKWHATYAKPVDSFTASYELLNSWITGTRPWPAAMSATGA